MQVSQSSESDSLVFGGSAAAVPGLARPGPAGGRLSIITEMSVCWRHSNYDDDDADGDDTIDAICE